MIREPVAVGSWAVAAAVSLLPDRLRPQGPGTDFMMTAAAFFLAAAATRYWLRETRTREQILAFIVAAAVLGVARRALDGRTFSLVSFAAATAGATAGALLVKFRLEGLSF